MRQTKGNTLQQQRHQAGLRSRVSVIMLTNLRLAYCGCPHTDIQKYEQPAFNQQVAALRADGILVLNLTTLCDGHHTLPV